MQQYTSKTTGQEEGFRPLADLSVKLEEIEAGLEAQLAAEGMPAEIEPTTAASLDGKLSLVAADADASSEVEESLKDSPEDSGEESIHAAEPEHESGPTPEDHELLERVKEHGWAAHPMLLEEHGADATRMAKLSGLGLAHMRATESGGRVFAMAGATDGDVEWAGQWVTGQRQQAHRAALESRVRSISRRVTGRLRRLGGACSEEGVTSALVSEGHPRKAVRAVISRLEETGEIRRENARWSRHPLLLLPEAGEDEITAASGSLFELTRRASRRRHALSEIAKEARKQRRPAPSMRLAEEISENSSHGDYDDRPEAATILRAAPHYFRGIWDVVTERVPKLDFESAREELAALPFKATLEAAGWESRRSRQRREANLKRMRAECIARRREGRPLEVLSAPELDARRSSPARSNVARKARRKERVRDLFRNARRNNSPERVALDTARAVLLSGAGPEEARLLVALASAPARRLTVTTAFAPVGLTPEGRHVMGRRMLGVLADPANGIHVPAGSKLARKVAAYRRADAQAALAVQAPATVPAA